jgi:hypothetical protein
MPVVPVTINGVAFPKAKGGGMQPFAVTIVGSAWITGLGVGGGPVSPGDPIVPDGPPLIIWGGPIDPYPDIGGPTPQPPPIITAPSDPKPPPPEGGWGWSPEYGWGYFPPPGSARPKA